MKIRTIKVIAAVVVFAGLAVPLASCGTQPAEAETPEVQTATVTRGNLTIDITAAGNLSLAETADLAFEVKGTVEEVLVEPGDTVKKGDVLARLDTKDWDDQVTTLERQLTAAKRKVTAVERQLATAQKDVSKQAEAKGLALTQAEINLKNAEIALEKAQNIYPGPDMEIAQANFDKAKAYLEYALDGLTHATGANVDTFERVVARAQADFDAAEKTLNTLKTGGDTDDIAIKKKQLEIARTNFKSAQDAIQESAENTRIAVEDAQAALEDAATAVEDAQEALDEAKSVSPEVKAPFDGFVTSVNVEGGDEVTKGTIAVQIADPNKFETEILVSEMDIFKVKVGGDAYVSADAVSGSKLVAKVTHISPTATVQSGVVNYKVRVEVQSLAMSAQGPQATMPAMAPPTQTGARPQQFGTSSTRSGTARLGQTGGVPADVQNIQLKQGLSVTVGITVSEKKDVILVPNRAITSTGREAYVQVKKADGTTEKRTVKTGISDWQNTEVLEGLTEGESVVVPKVTVPVSQQSTRGGTFMMPLGPPPGGR